MIRFLEGLTIAMVMMVGLGIETVPIMLVPSGSGVSSMENSVTLKPLSLFRPAGVWSMFEICCRGG